MKVILIKDVKSIGHINDIRIVSDGYARNFLLPKKLAVIATEQLITAQKNEQIHKEQNIQIVDKKNMELSKTIENMVLVLKARANEQGTLFSAITAKKIAAKLNKEIDSNFQEKDIILNDPIKKIGEQTICVSIHNNNFKLKINIINDK